MLLPARVGELAWVASLGWRAGSAIHLRYPGSYKQKQAPTDKPCVCSCVYLFCMCDHVDVYLQSVSTLKLEKLQNLIVR